MRRIGFIVFCLAGMGLYALGYRTVMTHVTHDFAMGVIVGGFFIWALWLIDDRFSRTTKQPRGGNDGAARRHIGTEAE